MLFHTEEFGKYIEITGYKNIESAKAVESLKNNRKHPQGASVQFFDADLIATKDHLYFACINALYAFRGKVNIARTVAVEIMLYASAQRQIQKAIERIGVKTKTKNLAVVIIGDSKEQTQTQLQGLNAHLGMEPDEIGLEMTSEKIIKIMRTFRITTQEIKTVIKNSNEEVALVNLVIEHGALLAIQF
jgi:tRNA threonylcarbamoyladenosine modification (KEOPS) complex Cgi121 subunit